MRLKPLARQVVVIVGASSGIGLATARMAAARGARLVLAARSHGALRRLTDEIRQSGGDAVSVPADASSEDDVRHVAEAAALTYGGFDTWINNAAVSAYGACLDVTVEDMRQIMETNFWGVVYGSRVACAHLGRHGGALINMGSVVSDRAVPLQGAYSASKHAIKAWTDSLRAELEHDRLPVAVTLIKPAAINTPYAEHAKNYFVDQPEHTFPVYSTRSVARAILHAAEHPVREVVVGGAGKALSLGSALIPRLVDHVMARFIYRGMHSGRPRRGRSALYSPAEDLREDGDYPGLVRPSLYTVAAMHPLLAGAIVASSVAVAGAAARRFVRS